MINHLIVPCRFCHAAVGEGCNLARGRVHPSRLENAALAMGFTAAEAAELIRNEMMTRVRGYRLDTGPSSLVSPLAGERCENSGETEQKVSSESSEA